MPFSAHREVFLRNEYVVRIKSRKHKRKVFRHLILASDDTETRPKVMKYHVMTSIIMAVIFCLVLGGFVGLVIFERGRDQRLEQTIAERDSVIEQLNDDKTVLNGEISSLNDKIEILSNTVATKTANENELTETLEAQSIPSEYPLTGSASVTGMEGDDPGCIFDASDGSTVVATAAGTVTEITEDEDNGNTVVIDHGNGYITIYTNKGDAMVKKGDEVSQGTTLFIIGDGNTELRYQISKEGIYIDPLDVIQIDG